MDHAGGKQHREPHFFSSIVGGGGFYVGGGRGSSEMCTVLKHCRGWGGFLRFTSSGDGAPPGCVRFGTF